MMVSRAIKISLLGLLAISAVAAYGVHEQYASDPVSQELGLYEDHINVSQYEAEKSRITNKSATSETFDSSKLQYTRTSTVRHTNGSIVKTREKQITAYVNLETGEGRLHRKDSDENVSEYHNGSIYAWVNWNAHRSTDGVDTYYNSSNDALYSHEYDQDYDFPNNRPDLEVYNYSFVKTDTYHNQPVAVYNVTGPREPYTDDITTATGTVYINPNTGVLYYANLTYTIPNPTILTDTGTRTVPGTETRNVTYQATPYNKSIRKPWVDTALNRSQEDKYTRGTGTAHFINNQRTAKLSYSTDYMIPPQHAKITLTLPNGTTYSVSPEQAAFDDTYYLTVSDEQLRLSPTPSMNGSLNLSGSTIRVSDTKKELTHLVLTLPKQNRTVSTPPIYHYNASVIRLPSDKIAIQTYEGDLRGTWSPIIVAYTTTNGERNTTKLLTNLNRTHVLPNAADNPKIVLKYYDNYHAENRTLLNETYSVGDRIWFGYQPGNWTLGSARIPLPEQSSNSTETAN